MNSCAIADGLREIELRNVLPAVFSVEKELHEASEVWLKPSLKFFKGEAYLIVSQSGKGKSSLCSYLFGLRTDYEGEILFNGINIRELSRSQWQTLRRTSLAYLPQEMRLFPELTVAENLRLKWDLTRFCPFAQVENLLEKVGIKEYARRLAGHLSIGQQQRAALVRALCQPFDFLLLDEPVSHLDEASNKAMAQLVEAQCSQRSAGLIATSVGNNLAAQFSKILNL